MVDVFLLFLHDRLVYTVQYTQPHASLVGRDYWGKYACSLIGISKISVKIRIFQPIKVILSALG